MDLRTLGACLLAASPFLPACLPMSPPFVPDWEAETDDPWVEEDDYTCDSGVTQSGAETWDVALSIAGAGEPVAPADFASVDIDVGLSPWVSEHLSGMAIEVTVVAGQAIVGRRLQLRCGEALITEADFGGELGNAASLKGSWLLEPWDAPCLVSLKIAGPPAEVPVPIRLTGSLSVAVDQPRGEIPCNEREVRAEVRNAG